MNRLLAFRQDQQSRRQKTMIAAIVASCAIIAIVLVLGRYAIERAPSSGNTVAVSETVNLWDTGTVRGEQPGQLQSVQLPAAQIHLTIILPRFSLPGQYLVAVTRDQNGSGIIAEGIGATASNQAQQKVSVDLNLRRVKAGAYFLSTTHEQDQAAYYYPLHIQ